VQIEFTEAPDADRARRLLYAQIEGQLRRARSRYALTSAVLFLLAAFLYEDSQRSAGLLIGVIVAAAVFAVFAVVIPKMALPPLLRRFERVNSVPATTVINDAGVTRTSAYYQTAWAWVAITKVDQANGFLIAWCGAQPVFTLAIESMRPEQAQELHTFLVGRGLLAPAIRLR
jgi:hypothetical protein